MFESYIPKKFCREFVELKGNSGQLSMIMATVKGVKPAMDDWIRVDQYEAYQRICKKYDLLVMPDVVFRVTEKKRLPENIIGKDWLATTIAFGSPFRDTALEDGNACLHVFISKQKNALERCCGNGWYPLIIKNRVIEKLHVDLYKYGHDLGYPVCCTDFFRRFNDWNKYSYLYEAFKNTPKADYHYLCNPFAKDDTYSYIYHMPCSYHCRETIKLAQNVRECIYEEEPDFVKEVDRHAKWPLLIFYERKFYAFEGKIKNGILNYKDVCFIGRMPENNLYERDLKKGDCVFLEQKDVVILKRGKLVARIKNQKKRFAPETPFIIQFN